MKWTVIVRTSKLSCKLLLISTEEEGQVRQELTLIDVVWGLSDVRKRNGVWDHRKRVKHLCAFLFLKKNRKLFLIDILSCNRRAESGIHFIFLQLNTIFVCGMDQNLLVKSLTPGDISVLPKRVRWIIFHSGNVFCCWYFQIRTWESQKFLKVLSFRVFFSKCSLVCHFSPMILIPWVLL